MKEIIVVGLGPGNIDNLSLGVWNVLNKAEKIFFRTSRHPVVQELAAQNIEFKTFDYLYETKKTFSEVYDAIVETLLGEINDGNELTKLVYGVPGNPLVGEESVGKLFAAGREQNITVTICPGMSFLDSIYGLLEIDPAEGLLVLDALSVNVDSLVTSNHLIFLQVYNRLAASDLKLVLLEMYPSDHPVVIIKAAGVAGEEKVIYKPLYKLDHFDGYDHLTSVYIKPYKNQDDSSVKVQYPLDPLIEIMEKLRSPQGCPWDIEQNHESLKPCLIEEAYEVIEAIDCMDMNKLLEELGDLLLQVVFHTTLAQERGDFTHNDVIKTVVDKMIRRHPHVFGDVIARNADEVIRNWENIKAGERGEDLTNNHKASRIMNKLNRSLPALLLAEEVQKKAHKAGFDWNDVQGAWDKVFEEINELKEIDGDKLEIENELGDVLFAVVNVARFLKVSPELALKRSIHKFISRFNYIEQKVQSNGKKWEDMKLSELDSFWEEAKKVL